MDHAGFIGNPPVLPSLNLSSTKSNGVYYPLHLLEILLPQPTTSNNNGLDALVYIA